MIIHVLMLSHVISQNLKISYWVTSWVQVSGFSSSGNAGIFLAGKQWLLKSEYRRHAFEQAFGGATFFL
jgi:hypothetical protein